MNFPGFHVYLHLLVPVVPEPDGQVIRVNQRPARVLDEDPYLLDGIVQVGDDKCCRQPAPGKRIGQYGIDGYTVGKYHRGVAPELIGKKRSGWPVTGF